MYCSPTAKNIGSRPLSRDRPPGIRPPRPSPGQALEPLPGRAPGSRSRTAVSSEVPPLCALSGALSRVPHFGFYLLGFHSSLPVVSVCSCQGKKQVGGHMRLATQSRRNSTHTTQIPALWQKLPGPARTAIYQPTRAGSPPSRKVPQQRERTFPPKGRIFHFQGKTVPSQP